MLEQKTKLAALVAEAKFQPPLPAPDMVRQSAPSKPDPEAQQIKQEIADAEAQVAEQDAKGEELMKENEGLRRPEKAEPSTAQEPPSQPAADEPITEQQRVMIHKLYQKLQLTPDIFINNYLKSAGDNIRSARQLSRAQGKALIDALASVATGEGIPF